LEEALTAQGFAVHRLVQGEAPDGPVENLFATRGTGAPHFAFAGHLDVVPPGGGWTSDPFEPEVRDGLLYGRGDGGHEGRHRFVRRRLLRDGGTHRGTLSLIITGDEEGPATYGTPAIMEWMEERSIRPT
jgi:succinyl-diaminopimelate desuccinylase